MTIYSNFKEMLEANKERYWRFWVYKRMFTPYEQEKKFADESVFEDSQCNCGYISEAVDLGNGDWLLGFQGDETLGYIQHYKLSEIRLAFSEYDQE